MIFLAMEFKYVLIKTNDYFEFAYLFVKGKIIYFNDTGTFEHARW